MSRSQEEIEARLIAQAKEVIAQLLAARKAPAEASLTDIEQVVLAAGQQFEQALTAELVAESAAALTNWPTCPQCGRKLKAKGKRRRRVVAETGEVTLKRDYYHCAACGSGRFPPG